MHESRGAPTRHSWLQFGHQLTPNEVATPLFLKNTAVSLLYMVQGDARGRWVCRGREFHTDGSAGAVRFNPADGEDHVLFGAAGRHGMRFQVLIIPPADIHTMALADGLHRLPDLRMHVWPHDPVLRKCLNALTTPAKVDDAGEDGDRDDAARALVLQVAELTGGERPDWHCDGCRFTKRTLDDLVSYIDAHLRVFPTASEMAALCGLCPSHFAKKFRHSTGLSLHRFIMRRRVNMALTMLQKPWDSLATIAFDLGFSSQSHFTRLFSDMTGMTPAKYRKQFGQKAG